MMTFITLAIFSYLFGSIPFALVVGKLKGLDIRKTGSKSTTSTNLARVLGWRWGVVSALLDLSKGFIPAILAKIFLSNIWQVIIVALLPTVGHVLPVWLNFRGGKGASTFYASSFVLLGPKYFLSFFPLWILILVLSKTMSLANLLFSWILVILTSVFFETPYLVFTLFGALFFLFAFRENIQRIKNGVEPRTSFKW